MIYLDHNATTPMKPDVVAEMVRAFAEPGNPSSVHAAGRRARDMVERARVQVAKAVDVLPEEIVFVSSGTEGDNQAIRGLAAVAATKGRPHVISSRIEHPAVRESVTWLANAGHPVTWLDVSKDGDFTVGDLEAALRVDTGLVSLALANHEIGNVYPLAEFATRVHQRGAWIHTDAVQALGKIPVSFRSLDVDSATFSAHKIGGPKGIAAVYIRRGLDLPPLLAGGHQERERHPGTENLAGIVGFACAMELAARQQATQAERLSRMRDELEQRLAAVPGIRFHGYTDSTRRVPGTTSVAFAHAPAQLVVIGLDLEGICISTGAACTSGSSQPSPVLRALGFTETEAAEGLRISLGWTTEASELDKLVAVLPRIVERVRGAATTQLPNSGLVLKGVA